MSKLSVLASRSAALALLGVAALGLSACGGKERPKADLAAKRQTYWNREITGRHMDLIRWPEPLSMPCWIFMSRRSWWNMSKKSVNIWKKNWTAW